MDTSVTMIGYVTSNQDPFLPHYLLHMHSNVPVGALA